MYVNYAFWKSFIARQGNYLTSYTSAFAIWFLYTEVYGLRKDIWHEKFNLRNRKEGSREKYPTANTRVEERDYLLKIEKKIEWTQTFGPRPT